MILPLGNEPGSEPGTHAIESDAPRRSYLFADTEGQLRVQPFFVDGTATPLPHAASASGGDARLQWYVEEIGPVRASPR